MRPEGSGGWLTVTSSPLGEQKQNYRKKMQSRKYSHYEILTNQISGQIIGWLLVYFMLPLMGIETTALQATGTTILFFISSYTRSYVIRRIFNNIKIINKE